MRSCGWLPDINNTTSLKDFQFVFTNWFTFEPDLKRHLHNRLSLSLEPKPARRWQVSDICREENSAAYQIRGVWGVTVCGTITWNKWVTGWGRIKKGIAHCDAAIVRCWGGGGLASHSHETLKHVSLTNNYKVFSWRSLTTAAAAALISSNTQGKLDPVMKLLCVARIQIYSRSSSLYSQVLVWVKSSPALQWVVNTAYQHAPDKAILSLVFIWGNPCYVTTSDKVSKRPCGFQALTSTTPRASWWALDPLSEDM